MTKIKFGESFISKESKAHIDDCIARNYVTMGTKTKQLEDLWAKKFGYKSVKAVSSGTAACIAALLTLYDLKNAKPGDEVIVPGLSFIATANAVRAAGFTPVFCDVNVNLVIEEHFIESLITERTVAIMPVSLMGKPPKMDFIRGVADKHKLILILDNCEGHGCKYQDKYMSEWADIVVYSCYAAHILFSGELGLVGCKTEEIGDLVESVRSHGRKPRSLYFSHERFGLNLKCTDIHASIGLGNMAYFDSILETRKKNLQFLEDNLQNNYFLTVKEDYLDYNSPHAFSMTVASNVDNPLKIDGLKGLLTGADIEWKRNFGAMPDHRCFSYLNKPGSCPISTYIGNQGIHVGVHQELSTGDLERIVEVINNYLNTL